MRGKKAKQIRKISRSLNLVPRAYRAFKRGYVSGQIELKKGEGGSPIRYVGA